MLDRDIRAALREEYLQKYYQDSDAKVVEEWPLFANKARIDIAVINGHLVGYEIKSDRDTIARLPDQLAIYSQIFDYITVITGPKHVDKLLNFLPHHCGLIVAEPTESKDIRLSTIVEPSRSPEQSKFKLASLLWHEEACLLLKAAGLGKGVRKKRVKQLWKEVAEAFTLDDLGSHVRSMLKAREAWKEHQAHEQYDG
ncbi:sce7726 family protein [Pontibacter sp. FD36]|uniref:sce7726 family protein n=1 Tax=Pontibacter sp. FD36 TaxID=2789860 RepID=UPI0018AA8B13|nr:sce7726 family protein [Pontibacter sp. FD36]MBF8964060.1 sce7726 family protein [Pontibacter sp. FD36]